MPNWTAAVQHSTRSKIFKSRGVWMPVAIMACTIVRLIVRSAVHRRACRCPGGWQTTFRVSAFVQRGHGSSSDDRQRAPRSGLSPSFLSRRIRGALEFERVAIPERSANVRSRWDAISDFAAKAYAVLGRVTVTDSATSDCGSGSPRSDITSR